MSDSESDLSDYADSSYSGGEDTVESDVEVVSDLTDEDSDSDSDNDQPERDLDILPEQKTEEPSRQIHKDIVIVDPMKRRTSDVMTMFELTEAVSIRATQLASRPISTTDISGLDNPINMAKKEIADGKCPLVLRRVVGVEFDKKNNRMIEYIECWNVNTMAKPVMYQI